MKNAYVADYVTVVDAAAKKVECNDFSGFHFQANPKNAPDSYWTASLWPKTGEDLEQVRDFLNLLELLADEVWQEEPVKLVHTTCNAYTFWVNTVDQKRFTFQVSVYNVTE